jgi:hypothetical protein
MAKQRPIGWVQHPMGEFLIGDDQVRGKPKKIKRDVTPLQSARSIPAINPADPSLRLSVSRPYFYARRAGAAPYTREVIHPTGDRLCGAWYVRRPGRYRR